MATLATADAGARTLAIDLGDCQRKAVTALIQARTAQRGLKSQEETASLFSRASLLFGKLSKPTSMGEIVDRSTHLLSLRRTGVVPEDIVQSEPSMTYKRLTNAYPLEDLVKFGFTFAHFRQLGFDVDDLRGLEPEHYRLLGLTAPVLLEHVPVTGDDLIQLKLSPHFLRELRFTFSHFVEDLTMSASQLSELMPDRDLQMYFSPSKSDMMRLRQSTASTASTASTTSSTTAAANTTSTGSRFAKMSSGSLKF